MSVARRWRLLWHEAMGGLLLLCSTGFIESYTGGRDHYTSSSVFGGLDAVELERKLDLGRLFALRERLVIGRLDVVPLLDGCVVDELAQRDLEGLPELVVLGEDAPVLDLNAHVFLQISDRGQRDRLPPVGVVGGRRRGRFLFDTLFAYLHFEVCSRALLVTRW